MIALGLPGGGILIPEESVQEVKAIEWRGWPCITFVVDGLPMHFLKKYDTAEECDAVVARIRDAREKQEAQKALEERKRETEKALEQMREEKERMEQEAKKEEQREKNRKRMAEKRKAEKEKPLADIRPITLKDGTKWKPFQEDLDDWVQMFPDIDVKEQFEKMRRYCLDKPQKRKTKTGIRRFVTNWLEKERKIAAEPTRKKTAWAEGMEQQGYDIDAIEEELLNDQKEEETSL